VPAALLAAGLVHPPPGVVPVTRFTTSTLTPHLTGTAAVIRRFLDVEVNLIGRLGDEAEIRVQPPGAASELVPLREG
jgi:RNA 3'-terminal phosphate cyclase